jgi:hypothetical protein
MFKVAIREQSMRRKVLSIFKALKVDVTQHTNQHTEQMTNMDYVKEFVFETSTITIHDVVKIIRISRGSVQTTLK